MRGAIPPLMLTALSVRAKLPAADHVATVPPPSSWGNLELGESHKLNDASTPHAKDRVVIRSSAYLAWSPQVTADSTVLRPSGKMRVNWLTNSRTLTWTPAPARLQPRSIARQTTNARKRPRASDATRSIACSLRLHLCTLHNGLR